MTEIYNGIIKHAERKDDPERLTLARKVWDPTPWVIDVYTGAKNDLGEGADERSIMSYCKENFGAESWPIHDRQGNWHRGGATVNGWTWFGFKTEDSMKKFIGDWPGNTKEEK